jgi:hypothetical protein
VCEILLAVWKILPLFEDKGRWVGNRSIYYWKPMHFGPIFPFDHLQTYLWQELTQGDQVF